MVVVRVRDLPFIVSPYDTKKISTTGMCVSLLFGLLEIRMTMKLAIFNILPLFLNCNSVLPTECSKNTSHTGIFTKI